MPVRKEQIPDFPGYFAGVNGTIWSAWRLRGRLDGKLGTESYIGDDLKPLKLIKHNAGYLCVKLRRDGKYHDRLVHRLILETYVGPCPNGLECLHKDNNKHNCRLENIRWGTHAENMQDAIENGTFYNATKAAALVNLGKERSQEVKDKIAAGHRGVSKSEDHKVALKKAHWSKGPNAAEIIARREETKRLKGNSGRPR